MNRMTMPVFAALSAALCAGCSQHDSTKLDDLNLKMAAVMQQQLIIYTNQAALTSELESVKHQIAALPSMEQVDGMEFYYHTNVLNTIQASQADTMLVLGRLELCTGSLEFDLTNRVTADTIYTRLTADQIEKDIVQEQDRLDLIQSDLVTIKSRMSIP